MDFFGRQAATRRLSRRLVSLFVLAVVVVALAVNAVILAVVRALESGFSTAAPFDLEWLAARAGLVAWTTSIVFGVVAIASLYRTATLRQGGGVVAQSLGGTRVDADTRDPLQRRLLNVVEEMAIASGVPVPQVYVLEHETGINAFAAGHTPANAAVAVTRGALTRLDRNELQGVIAHEFSHILNGDMRLSIRMMGLLFGLLAIAVIGRTVLRHAPRGSGRGRGGSIGIILLAAMAVTVLGHVGLFCGRLLQAAVSRSRESLADAAAVQFTRNPQGLRDALVKIGANATGSRILDADAEEVAHMLFAPGVKRLFATHPALLERIRSLDPAFDPREFAAARARMLAEEVQPVQPESPGVGGQEKLAALLAPAIAAPLAVVRLVGNPGTAHVRLAGVLRDSLPESMMVAARQPRQALALLLAFVVDADPSVRDEQLGIVRQRLGAGAVEAVAAWLPAVGSLGPLQRLPAFMHLLPALHHFPGSEKEQLSVCLTELLRHGHHRSLHAYVLARVAAVYLEDEREPAGHADRLTIDAVQDELGILFSVLATFGHAAETDRRHAYEIGMQHLLPRRRPAYRFPEDWPARLERALVRLDHLQPMAKEQLVEALVRTISNDLSLAVSEAELLRAVCATVHCPLPPLLAEVSA